VHPRGCSRPLQRVVTDLGADLPFAQAAGKLQEHYGVILSPSTIRQVSEGHARALIGDADAEPVWPTQAGAAMVIAHVDGGMVPLVEVDLDRPDCRRVKRLLWKEAKLSLAHAHGSTTRVCGETLGGGVEVAWQQLLARCGSPIRSRRASAPRALTRWTSSMSVIISPRRPRVVHPMTPRLAWGVQKKRMKNNDGASVLAALGAALEPATVSDADARVRACHRYLSNRLDQLDYQGALARGLPIGSGEIENPHCYVVQQRLKRAGAWWIPDNAEAMLALRVTRTNGRWSAYWQNDLKQAA